MTASSQLDRPSAPTMRYTWVKTVLCSAHRPVVKVVAVALSAYMGAKRNTARPSIKTLARDTGYSYSAVERALRDLRKGTRAEARVFLRVQRRANKTNVYEAVVEAGNV